MASRTRDLTQTEIFGHIAHYEFLARFQLAVDNAIAQRFIDGNVFGFE